MRAALHSPATSAQDASPTMTYRRVRQCIWGSLATALIVFSAWAAHTWAFNTALMQLHGVAHHRLDALAARLNGELARFDYLPSLLESSPDVFSLLDAPTDQALRQRVSRYLQDITATAGADNLYVTNPSGMTLAAADFERPGTPLGTDLSFRPYVRDALALGRGRFFGVGFTTGRAGYYLAYALKQGGAQRGVATVKVRLDVMEGHWSQLPGKVVVLDAHDVVILASQSPWKLHPIKPLPPALLAEAANSRTYGTSNLAPLAWLVHGRLDQSTTRVRLESVNYLATERAVNSGLWRIVLLDDEKPVRDAARNAAIGAALTCAVLLLLAVAVQQEFRAVRLQRASRRELQAAHDGLEAKVLERTSELRSVQNDLVHAGKLAALGQMSAGVVHELNQPLAAMRTLSDNAAVLLTKGRLQEASANLERIANLTNRLGRMTQQLKVFAYKSSLPTQRVSARKAVQDALLIVAARMRKSDVVPTITIEPEDLGILAEDVRLEQVLVNLMGNAIEAMSGAVERRLDIRATRQGKWSVICIGDSGPGIHPDVMLRLFEPFVTTKPAGKGLGLGLMISAHIVREFGGRLSAGNRFPNGAEFVIELPAMPPEDEGPAA